MTVPPPRPENVRRNALAARLTSLRVAAGLSGNALAKRMGIVQSRVWKIEHSELTPGEDDIRAWVQATSGSEETVRELITMLNEAQVEFQAFKGFRRESRAAAAYQEQVRLIEARSARIGNFQVAMIPGILQTADYAREILEMPCGPRSWGTDEAGIEATIGIRLRRQEILHDPGKRVQVVLSEAALRTLVVSRATLAGQLEKLLSVMSLPTVELGVVGFGQVMPVYPLTSFTVHDSDLIVIENLAGEDHLTVEAKPDEVAAFLRAFDMLREAASSGDEARRLITAAAAALREDT